MRARLGEMLSGVLPVAVVDRHWHQEELDLWGLNVATDIGVVPNRHHAVSLHNPSTEDPLLEVLVWRVNACLFDVNTGRPRPGPIHLFTPLTPAYNPHSSPATIPLHFPWLQTPASFGDEVALSRVHGDAGGNPALQVVTVNGVATTSIGPSVWTITGHGLAGEEHMPFAELGPGPTAPPLRVKPGQRLTVQHLISQGLLTLQANFWFSQRPFYPGT
jgi:hypothetical protein